MSAAPLIGVSTGFTDYGDYLGVAFSRPLEDRGAQPVVIPYLRDVRPLLRRLDGVLLAVGRDVEPRWFGGAPHPSSTLHSALRDRCEFTIIGAALAMGMPVLGICRGMQLLNVALGGTLHPDHTVLPGPAAGHPGGDWDRWEQVVSARVSGTAPPGHPTHPIIIEPGSLLGRVLGAEAIVNSYHHQSIAELGEGVEVVARAADGVIEAVEVPAAAAMCLGVQWELQEEPGSPVFDLFVAHASRHQGSPGRVAPAAAVSPASPSS